MRASLHSEIDICWVNAEDLERNDPETLLGGVAAILVPGGFGPRGMEGMVVAAGYARKNRIPFLGIGLGMQMAVVEHARNAAGIAGAHSGECENECQRLFYLPAPNDALRPSSDGGSKAQRRRDRRTLCRSMKSTCARRVQLDTLPGFSVREDMVRTGFRTPTIA